MAVGGPDNALISCPCPFSLRLSSFFPGYKQLGRSVCCWHHGDGPCGSSIPKPRGKSDRLRAQQEGPATAGGKTEPGMLCWRHNGPATRGFGIWEAAGCCLWMGHVALLRDGDPQYQPACTTHGMQLSCRCQASPACLLARFRVDFKVLLLTYKALKNIGLCTSSKSTSF